MKNTITILLCLIIFQFSYSQNCEKISPYKEGMKLEYTNFNKKGKVKSVETYFVESVTNDNGNLTMHINSTETKDTKKFTLKCVNGNFYVDMSNYSSLQGDSEKSSFQVKATGDFIEFPDQMKVGTELADGKIDLEIGSEESFGNIASMAVLNRKVLANDDLVTKAGTFNGYKISFDYIFDLGLIKFRGSGIEWYVKGIGIVKTENYSKKGKLRWYRELTKISNN